MKTLFIISLLFAFIGCKQSAPKDSTETPAESKISVLTQTTDKTLKTVNRDSFLLKPFDLYKFKMIKRGANSGGGGQRKYFFKPNYKGIYYHFFIFGANGHCYIEKDTLFREDGLQVVTYKPIGDYQNEYLDPNEELIYLESHCNDFDLPELAFIGLDTTEIKNKLGEFTFEKEKCAVYTYKNKALVLGLSSAKVEWLKYIYLNEVLTSEKDFKGIYNVEQ